LVFWESSDFQLKSVRPEPKDCKVKKEIFFATNCIPDITSNVTLKDIFDADGDYMDWPAKKHATDIEINSRNTG